MGVKMATNGCFQWSSSQPIIPHSHPPSSSIRRCHSDAAVAAGGALVCRYVHILDKSSTLLGISPSTKLHRSRSYEHPKPSRQRAHTIKRACSASQDATFSDEEFSKKIHELALRFQLPDDDTNNDSVDSESTKDDSRDPEQNQKQISCPVEPPWQDSPPEWHGRAGDDIIIERKANSVDLPLSLRIIKRKMKWEEGFCEAGESAYCSVKKAFSSLVFIIRELLSYSLQMREVLFTEDLQGILMRVHSEIHASFVWLFQQVFSHTPTLMVYVMILLANFTVYSMGSSAAAAATASPTPTVSSYAIIDTENAARVTESENQKFESSTLKSFSISSSPTNGKSTSMGGNNGGGGGKVLPAASGTEGDGHFNHSNELRPIVPDGGASQLSSPGTAGGETESISGEEKEVSLWNLMVDEARKMQASFIDSATVKRFVSPVNSKMEPEDYADFVRTELLYQVGLSQDPNNPLLLANYAQFLYLVAHDYDRAEVYFKRAIEGEPIDPEAYSKYAGFLWRARKDLWAAEQTFLDAISAEPDNSFYAASYAHFLWTTGGDDTCFPLTSPES